MSHRFQRVSNVCTLFGGWPFSKLVRLRLEVNWPWISEQLVHGAICWHLPVWQTAMLAVLEDFLWRTVPKRLPQRQSALFGAFGWLSLFSQPQRRQNTVCVVGEQVRCRSIYLLKVSLNNVQLLRWVRRLPSAFKVHASFRGFWCNLLQNAVGRPVRESLLRLAWFLVVQFSCSFVFVALVLSVSHTKLSSVGRGPQAGAVDEPW